MTDEIIRKQLDFLGPAYDAVLESAKQLKFDAESSSHVLAVALHGTVVELIAACISMLSSGYVAGIPILMRSMYEALVDQANLLTDAAYAKNMEAANLRQMEKLLMQAGDDHNALLKGLSASYDVPKELQQLRELSRPT